MAEMKNHISIKILLYVLLGLMVASCDQAGQKPKAESVFYVSIPASAIGPTNASSYDKWSKVAAMVVNYTVGSRCYSDEYFYYSVSSKKDAKTLISTLTNQVVQETYISDADFDRLCEEAYLNASGNKYTIAFRTPQDDARGFVNKVFHDNFQASLTQNIHVDRWGKGKSVEFTYPKNFVNSEQDFRLVEGRLRQETGGNCCI
ncbi:hypothetical protein [Asticcacaulis sp.]|uniref:hypothetical protein n=1 Tax=Asticcacaulis sp. TaxID=1872648 RepID=UPI0031D5000D